VVEPTTARRLEREDSFVARSATAEDRSAILRVLQIAFDRWPPVAGDRSALEHLEWKMSFRFGSEPHGVVEYEGEVIACKLRWFARVSSCGVEHLTDVGADHAALPEFQGRGGRLLNELEMLAPARRRDQPLPRRGRPRSVAAARLPPPPGAGRCRLHRAAGACRRRVL